MRLNHFPVIIYLLPPEEGFGEVLRYHKTLLQSIRRTLLPRATTEANFQKLQEIFGCGLTISPGFVRGSVYSRPPRGEREEPEDGVDYSNPSWLADPFAPIWYDLMQPPTLGRTVSLSDLLPGVVRRLLLSSGERGENGKKGG